MTQPVQEWEFPPVDQGNPWAVGQPLPGNLTVSHARHPAGQFLVATIRYGPITLSVMLSKEAALNWAKVIETNAQQMSGIIVPPPGTTLPGLNGQQLGG